MKTKRELGMEAGKIAVLLKKDNRKFVRSSVSGHKRLAKKYADLYRYLTGNVVSGVYPMPHVYATMEEYAKRLETKEAINSFVRDMAEAGLTQTSFYPYTGVGGDQEWPWIGEEFEQGVLEGIIKYNTGLIKP